MPDDCLTSFVQAIAADDYADDEQPDLGPLRALAEREEVAGVVSRLGRQRRPPAARDDPWRRWPVTLPVR